jgi:hypothetical protein
MTRTETRTVNCPECHASCGWCSWYAKNARDAGCGCPRSPRGRIVKCQWGELLKGTACSLCGGSGRVSASITFSRDEDRA